MQEIFSYICENAHHAPWIFFFLLLLSGLNLPISEDIILLGGGALASTCLHGHALELYIWIFLGCYLSGWEGYWIGRLLGPRIYTIPLLRKIVTPRRLQTLRKFYAKFGVFTFIVGRFCPGGIRNALFVSSGLTRMPFHLFMVRDGVACLFSSLIFFNIGYRFGENYEVIIHSFEHYTFLFSAGLILLGLCALFYYWRQRKYNSF